MERGVGIDIDPERIEEATANARAAGVDGQVSFRNEDLFEADIEEASAVMLYLWPWVNLKLKDKSQGEAVTRTYLVDFGILD